MVWLMNTKHEELTIEKFRKLETRILGLAQSV